MWPTAGVALAPGVQRTRRESLDMQGAFPKVAAEGMGKPGVPTASIQCFAANRSNPRSTGIWEANARWRH